MAELVTNDALQFVAREHLDAAARHADGGIASRVAGSEGVDATLIFQNVNLRHRHTGGDGHFLNNIEQLAFVRVDGVLTDEPTAH